MAKRTPAPKAPRKPKALTAAAALEVVEAFIGKAEAKPKVARGKYKPEMCATIVRLGKTGKSKAQCAAHLDISRSTFDRYLETYEAFREAWELADTYAQAFWEDIGLGGVGNKFFNDRAWSLQVRNRWSHSYKENRELDVTSGGAPIQIVLSPADAKL